MLAQPKVEVPASDESDDLLTDEERNLSADQLAAIDQAWRVEIERRIADLRAGRSRTVPSEEVHAMLRARFPAWR